MKTKYEMAFSVNRIEYADAHNMFDVTIGPPLAMAFGTRPWEFTLSVKREDLPAMLQRGTMTIEFTLPDLRDARETQPARLERRGL